MKKPKKTAFSVTLAKIKKLNLTLEDIAGIFYRSNGEYEKIARDLAECSGSDDDLIVNICLAKVFHERFSSFDLFGKSKSNPHLYLAIKLAADLPFFMNILNTNTPEVRLDVLRKNFKILSNLLYLLRIKPNLSTKFDIWRFAYTINRIYNNDNLAINLDILEAKFFLDDKAMKIFQEMKKKHIDALEKEKKHCMEFLKRSNNIIDC